MCFAYFVSAQSAKRPGRPPCADSRHAGDGGDGVGLSLWQRRVLSVVQSADNKLDRGDPPALRLPLVKQLSFNKPVKVAGTVCVNVCCLTPADCRHLDSRPGRLKHRAPASRTATSRISVGIRGGQPASILTRSFCAPLSFVDAQTFVLSGTGLPTSSQTVLTLGQSSRQQSTDTIESAKVEQTQIRSLAMGATR